MQTKAKKFTIKEFNAQYPNDDACLAEVFKQRYGSLKSCPDCKKETNFYKVTGRKCYACQFCGYQLHPLADTIFHKSDTSLKSWFYAIFLFANSKNGVSGKELQRQLGVTYKTAWRMAKQIRLLFKHRGGKLAKTVEVDETYVGGKTKTGSRAKGTKRGRGAANKTVVFGMVERGGNIKATVTKNLKNKTIYPIIEENINKSSTIYTDELSIYWRLNDFGYKHGMVAHAEKQFVNGEIHTNTIEGFWSQLKRSIRGTYHSVSRKYLQHYVDEFSYRYNLRHADASSVFPSMLSEVARPVL